MIEGKYYQYKKYEYNYSKELERCIKNTYEYCEKCTFGADDDKQKQPIMMLGEIQSGKTRAFIGVIALAFDNGFDMVFVLSKNSKALVQQTESRMKKEFKPFILEQEIEVKNIIKMSYNLTGYQLEKKFIIIAKKEKNNLNKIIDFIRDYSINKNKKCLIIDDEADATGIGYNKNKETDEFDLRTVASKVNEIRGNLDGCVFIQVTATPYALYLQPEFNENDKPKPIKPKQTVLVPSGNGYIGGEYYFVKSKDESHPARFLFTVVSPEELEIVSTQRRKGKKLKINDRRVFKEEEILIKENKLPVFKKGIVNFIVGGIVLSAQIKKKDHYAYVIHTATQKGSHFSLKKVVDILFEQIRNRDEETTPLIENLITMAYEDIKRSVEAYHYQMPYLKTVKEDFYKVIDKEYYSVDIVNSENQIEDLLDEDSGELSLRTPFSIFVGGQVLDRGVTIPNMIGFYYGRNPVTMQQDTVMQHSRMFGYRKKEQLSVTRFYTTERIYNNMVNITEIDLALREDIESGKLSNGIYFIQRQKDDKAEKYGNIIPCSPDKILISDTILLIPHKRILPVEFTPINKTKSDEFLKELKKRLQLDLCDGKTIVKSLCSSLAEEIIELVYCTFHEDEGATRFVSVDEFISVLRYLMGDNKETTFVIKKNKNNSKYRQSGRIEDAPETGDLELKTAHELAVAKPVVIILQENGQSEGWLYRPFYWPILVSPRNISKTIYALKTPTAYIKNLTS